MKKLISNVPIYKRKETLSHIEDNEFVYITGMSPRLNMSFITSAWRLVNFNSKDSKL